MPELVGHVKCIRVGYEFCFAICTEQSNGVDEVFTLWWDGLSTPANPPPSLRIVQSDWVALMRQAMASNILVTITYQDISSNLVESVELGIGGI